MPIFDVFVLALVLGTADLYRRYSGLQAVLKESQQEMLLDQTLRRLMEEFFERDYDLSPEDKQTWLQALLLSIPLDIVPTYVKELGPKSGVTETNLFGHTHTDEAGRQILLVTGLREVSADGSWSYVPVSVSYFELSDDTVLRCASGSMSDGGADEYEIKEGSQHWRSITEAESDERLRSIGYSVEQ
jgi:hypothetical protein